MYTNECPINLNTLSTFILLAGFLYIPCGKSKNIEQFSVSRTPGSTHHRTCSPQKNNSNLKLMHMSVRTYSSSGVLTMTNHIDIYFL